MRREYRVVAETVREARKEALENGQGVNTIDRFAYALADNFAHGNQGNRFQRGEFLDAIGLPSVNQSPSA